MLTPGIYRLPEPIRVPRAGTVVLGLGLATLMPVGGSAALMVADVGGVTVAGDDVTAYGLFVEHFRRNQVLWQGEGGRTFFFQSELPYDPPSQALYRDGDRRGWAAYRVAADVRRHEAVGLGIYANFTADPTIVVDSAIEAPTGPGVTFDDITTISLGGGKGTIAHLVNDTGSPATAGAIRQTLTRYEGRASARQKAK